MVLLTKITITVVIVATIQLYVDGEDRYIYYDDDDYVYSGGSSDIDIPTYVMFVL